MGTMFHHALIVTTWDADKATMAHKVASGLSPHVTPLVTSNVNFWYSFAVLPDGSKEGWPQSDDGDDARAAIIRWLNDQAYEDGGNALSWAEVGFGELPATLNTNCEPHGADSDHGKGRK